MKKKIVLVLALFVLMAAPLAVKFAVSARTSAHADDSCPSNANQLIVTDIYGNQQTFCSDSPEAITLPGAILSIQSNGWSGTVHIANVGDFNLCPGDYTLLSPINQGPATAEPDPSGSLCPSSSNTGN